MSSPKSGSPSIIVNDRFGGKQNINIDTNRVDIFSETLFRVGNAIAIPSRDIFADLSLWILAPAVIFRLLLHGLLSGLLPPAGFSFLFTIILAPVGLLISQVAIARRSHFLMGIYRMISIFVGLLLGIL